MKINTINEHKNNFGRIIPIYSQSNPKYDCNSRKLDNSTLQIVKILNSEPVSKYTQEETEKIRMFFKNILGDYNGKNGIIMRRTYDGDIVLLSGQDAKDIKTLENESMKRKHKKGKKNSMINKHFLADKEIKVRVENGLYLKPETSIELKNSYFDTNKLTSEQNSGKKPISLKFNEFNYYSILKYFVSVLDGHYNEDIPPTDKATETNNCMNVSYEENHLNL